MKRLIIVGNGFDKHHKMKTEYSDYREYLISSGQGELVNCFESDEEIDSEYMWNNLESIIGGVNYEQAYCYLIPYYSDDWRDSSHHDFQNAVREMTQFWPGLKNNLAPWIRNISYTYPDCHLVKLIEESDSFLSFNYTNTLEKLYNVPKSRIVYIHGDASVTDDLVLGHRSDSWYPEWDPTNHDLDVRLLEASAIMDKHLENTRKQIESIIELHSDFFTKVHSYDEIYVLGLSYNDTDKLYLQKISQSNPKAKWFFNWYDKNDFNSIDGYADSLNIAKSNYTPINIDNW